MSEEKLAIQFALNSMELADIFRKYSSEQMNDFEANEELDLDFSSFIDADYEGLVYTDNNIIIGSLIASEYDGLWDGWRPEKPIPEGKGVIKWITEVVCHGDYENKIEKEGIEYIEANAESLEKSLKKYKIIHVESMPFAESNIHYEEYDGERHIAYRMYPDNWKKMWDASCQEEAGAIFAKHRRDMNSYSLEDGFAGDIFYDLYDTPVFMELLKQFGDVKILDISSGGTTRVSSGIKNSSYSFFKTREINPETIDFKKKTICSGTLSFYYDENEDAFYGDAGTPFDVARIVIEHLGGKMTKSVSPKTDYIIVPEYLSLLGERSYLYDGYKDELKRMKKSVSDADKKRAQKNLPKIGAIKEEELYDWLRAKYMKLNATTDLFRPYGEIRIVLLPKDKNAYTNFTFRSEAFFNIHKEQMEKAAYGIESLSEFMSNIEDITEVGIFSKSGVKKNDYINAVSMDEQYKWYVDYRAIKFSYESSNGISYDIRKKY